MPDNSHTDAGPPQDRPQAPPIVVALDYPSAAAALALVARLSPALCRLKVGNELYTRAGPPLVTELVRRGFDVFLDLKFHDIPNTVAGACRAAAALGVWMVNVHISGGREMLMAAREALQAAVADSGRSRPLLIGVTVLTSLDAAALAEVGVAAPPADQVLRLAELGAAAGLDGVVCSAREATLLRNRFGRDFVLVTPGIRDATNDDGRDDQRRTLTAAAAVEAGADHLVIGRPITRCDDPAASLRAFADQIATVRRVPAAGRKS